MLFSCNQNDHHNVNLTVNGVSVTQVYSIKFLGILIDILSWEDHVKHVISKISSGLYSIRIMQNYLPDYIQNPFIWLMFRVILVTEFLLWDRR